MNTHTSLSTGPILTADRIFQTIRLVQSDPTRQEQREAEVRRILGLRGWAGLLPRSDTRVGAPSDQLALEFAGFSGSADRSRVTYDRWSVSTRGRPGATLVCNIALDE